MVKITIEVDDDLWRRFSIIVLQDRGERKKSKVIAELIREYVERRGLPDDPWQLECILRLEEERGAFLKAKSRLLRDDQYRGKYVAVFKGKVVDCDEDKARLARRVYKKYGYIPIYIDRVIPEEDQVNL
ncbi:hypothetical protein J7L70_01115 [Candidatus Bathyarchaeota archaeon]|nr:hypothetical protein [Candidatus Bathyarchaeota archaeon]